MARKLSKPAVAQRYGGVHPRTIDRWLADPELKFPKPIYIGSNLSGTRASLRSGRGREPRPIRGGRTPHDRHSPISQSGKSG